HRLTGRWFLSRLGLGAALTPVTSGTLRAALVTGATSRGFVCSGGRRLLCFGRYFRLGFSGCCFNALPGGGSWLLDVLLFRFCRRSEERRVGKALHWRRGSL